MASETQQRQEIADVNTPMLESHWYLAGYADEFNEGLHERTLLDRSILIYKTSEGEIIGLQNRCAHRSFPLSHGSREGDEVRCRYHGAKYNACGEMVEFPSVPKCPRISLHRYPMKVSGPIVWIWMGEPADVDYSAIPSLPFLDKGWRFTSGGYEFGGNWLLLAENLMDLTHVPFLHNATIKYPRAYAETPIKMEIKGDQISYYRENPEGYQRTGYLPVAISEAIERAGFNARSTVWFISPALIHGGGRFNLERPQPGEPSVYEWHAMHFITPISKDRTQYRYFFSRNYALDDVALDQKIEKIITPAFQEDRFAIELVQKMHDNDPRAFREVHFRSDAPALAMRRLVASMANREAESKREDGKTATVASAPVAP